MISADAIQDALDQSEARPGEEATVSSPTRIFILTGAGVSAESGLGTSAAGQAAACGPPQFARRRRHRGLKLHPAVHDLRPHHDIVA